MRQQYATLSNGLEIPTVGLGTWLIDNKDVVKVVKEALDMGYRHIDTAQAYENEQGVGEGIKASGVSRDQIFLTDKVRAEYKTYNRAAESIDESLAALGTDYIDLLLIHCPQPWDKYRGTEKFYAENLDVWRAMEDAYKAGKVKAIGVANFEGDDLNTLLEGADIKPMADQVLAHVGNTPFNLLDFAQDQNIVVEAYSPMGHGEVLNNQTLQDMAAKYDVSVADLCLEYDLQLGMVALPKAKSVEHLRNNLKAWTDGFEISEDDMAYLKTLKLTEYGESAKWPCYSPDKRSR